MLVLRGGDVVDANGIREADIAVENGEIVSVGDVPDADEEIDVSGKFVAPGLIDSHIHSSMDGRPDVTTLDHDSEMMLSYRAVSNLRDALHAGVTTVRDLGSPTTLALDAADAVETGLIEGPRIVACGQNVVMTGGHGHWFGREADGEAEVKKQSANSSSAVRTW